jgi:phosphoribosylamine-glycine ligase
MATASGVKLIEYNARFGDPEAMNVLSIFESDFVGMARAVAAGRLDSVEVRFQRKATVCKYVVPKGYPETPRRGESIALPDPSAMPAGLRLFPAAVEETERGIVLTGSRAVAAVGVAGTLAEAEKIAESGAQSIRGPVRHRRDIGTADLIEKRILHMAQLRRSRNSPPATPVPTQNRG